jgi:hypothetical protein
MSLYAELNVELTAVTREEPYDDAWYAACVAANSPKVIRIRPLVIDALPVLTATQVAERGSYVIANPVRRTWVVRQMTADELEDVAIAEAKANYNAHIDALNVQLDITNAMRGAMSANQRLNTLEADTRATMRAVKDLLRQAKRAR